MSVRQYVIDNYIDGEDNAEDEVYLGSASRYLLVRGLQAGFVSFISAVLVAGELTGGMPFDLSRLGVGVAGFILLVAQTYYYRKVNSHTISVFKGEYDVVIEKVSTD